MRVVNKALILLILLFTISSVQAKFSVGILGGANSTGLNEDEIEDGIFKNRLGFASGILGEERFTRIKHDFSFPVNAINFCLEFDVD
jgi:hypothetical protein